MKKAPADATEFSDGVTKSTGAAINALAQNSATAMVADAAPEAMTHALAFGSFLTAGFLVVGVVATLFIPSTRHADITAEDSRENDETETARSEHDSEDEPAATPRR
ncbi:hypothetical protein BRM1_01760 [Brevibacterium sp. BRM-1]|uniref:hypothetical protein n=1 Tax=Brevibacterium sp. BRM-1 TaxID=2999062 RepID=UPI002282C11B|nr:hypothetical protein [Brevibacterium sp. BRM-1]WAL40627.1 hypothetical protein BRM1_01760 [Brevibacterium sp. BRM-1]